MDLVTIVIAAVLCAAVVIVAVAVTAVVARRAVVDAVERTGGSQAVDHDASVRAALEHLDLVNRAERRAQSASDSATLTSGLDAVRGELQRELERLRAVVAEVGATSAQRFGQVDEALRAHAAVSGRLADSTASLREALANPQARGRWGERMAEDVLRLAGFVENVNYRKQATIEGGRGRPDFTFDLPKGHVLFMDVKFPLAAYLRALEAPSDDERTVHVRQFLRDVRARVRELATRRYVDGTRPTVDYVLLFLPNEQLTGFIHEHDGALIDDSLRQGVVLCSPLTLFAFLGVIRQAFDNFVIEQTSDEILSLVGEFDVQWRRYVDSAHKLGRHLQSVHDEYDRLTSTRQRALERPLRRLDDLRRQRLASDEGSTVAGTIRPVVADRDADIGGRVAAADGPDETPGRHVSAVV